MRNRFARVIERKGYVHEAADGKESDADRGHDAHLVALHHHGNQGDQNELRQASPGEHVADLLGVLELHLAEILRQDIDGAEQA
ncbi:MAG TPA: hypothetical protein VKB76_01600, partial [Ktedonobacterales bacterium]|nr:hypothetical protein [Ktedonobacterales bacterium]